VAEAREIECEPLQQSPIGICVPLVMHKARLMPNVTLIKWLSSRESTKLMGLVGDESVETVEKGD
jgi:hypothetical protein